MSILVWLKEAIRIIKTSIILFSKIRLGLGFPDATGFIRQLKMLIIVCFLKGQWVTLHEKVNFLQDVLGGCVFLI